MMDCPKCGFNQPEDTFCASCGVDMQSYVPPRPPLFKLIFGHWAAQVGLILFALTFGFYLLHQRQMAINAAQEGEEAANQANPIFKPRSDRALAKLDNKFSAQPKIAAANPVDNNRNASMDRTAVNNPSNVSANDSSSSNAPIAPLPKRLKIVLAELPRSYLTELHKSANRNTLASAGALNSGVAASDTNLSRMPASAQGYNSQETFTLSSAEPMKLSRLGQSSGITLFASFLPNDPAGTDINVEMTLNGPNQLISQIQSLNQTQQFSFIIPPKSFGFIDGFLGSPNPSGLAPQDLQAFSDSPLKVLSSQNYLSGQSDLVVFLIPMQ